MKKETGAAGEWRDPGSEKSHLSLKCEVIMVKELEIPPRPAVLFPPLPKSNG
jgi:hypothetical protein